MISNQKLKEVDLLEKFRVALENAGSMTEISEAMKIYGYEETKIQEGKSLYVIASDTFLANSNEDKETSIAYKQFKEERKKLSVLYSQHRRVAKVAFRNNGEAIILLELNIGAPHAYAPWFSYVRNFYMRIQNSEEISAVLLSFNVTPIDINNAIAQCNLVEQKRTEYLREVGESQEATKVKDRAIGDISLWMRDFYDIAKIALEDKPQLMEALGVVVKS